MVVVAAPGPGDETQLVGLYTGFPVAAGNLRGRLRDHLPSYMIPRRFLHQSVLPRNPNGKLDRAGLSRLADPRSSGPCSDVPGPDVPAGRPVMRRIVVVYDLGAASPLDIVSSLEGVAERCSSARPRRTTSLPWNDRRGGLFRQRRRAVVGASARVLRGLLPHWHRHFQ